MNRIRVLRIKYFLWLRHLLTLVVDPRDRLFAIALNEAGTSGVAAGLKKEMQKHGIAPDNLFAPSQEDEPPSAPRSVH